MSDNDAIAQMLLQQQELQQETYGIENFGPGMDPEDRLEQVRVNVLALTDELHEALGCVGWKPWTTSQHFDETQFKGELIDAWHFFMNLMNLGGMTATDLITGYQAKHDRNIQRQEDGYDGVSGKCPRCHKAYDDNGVYCHPRDGIFCGAYCDTYDELVSDDLF